MLPNSLEASKSAMINGHELQANMQIQVCHHEDIIPSLAVCTPNMAQKNTEQ